MKKRETKGMLDPWSEYPPQGALYVNGMVNEVFARERHREGSSQFPTPRRLPSVLFHVYLQPLSRLARCRSKSGQKNNRMRHHKLDVAQRGQCGSKRTVQMNPPKWKDPASNLTEIPGAKNLGGSYVLGKNIQKLKTSFRSKSCS